MNMSIALRDPAFYLKVIMVLGVISLLFYMGSAHATAAAPEGSIGEVADNIKGSFSSLAKVITAGAYVGGMGFVLGSIFKFKAHKDNPTQIPIGTPIALLFIGAAMIFLPQIFSVTGSTMFGNQGEVAGVDGTDEFGSFGS